MVETFDVYHSSIVIPNYELGESEKLEGSLSVWDKATFSLNPIGYYYDEEKETLYLPRGLDISFIEKELDRRAIIHRDHDEYRKTFIRLRDNPRDDLQKKSISFLVGGTTEFMYTKKASQLALTLSTGAGKTYCAVAATSIFGVVPLVITHNNNIKKQWQEAYQEHTDVDHRSICDIKGSAVINKLMSDPSPNHKVYLVNRRTLQSYAKRNGWDRIGDFLRHIGIGVKIYDEAHLEFESILMTDFHTNTFKSIYLTANLERSDRDEARVYKLCFKNVYEYGSISSVILKKHMVYLAAFFDSKPSYTDRATLKTVRGLSIPAYTDYLMNSEEFFVALEKILDVKVSSVKKNKKKRKIVIMTATIASNAIVEEHIKHLYPDMVIRQYNSSINEREKEKVIEEADIIVTTSKSLGTGSNIENIQMLINCEPYSSTVTANQVSGRLRPLKDEQPTFYTELVDKGMKETMNMYNRRKGTLIEKANRYLTIDYTK